MDKDPLAGLGRTFDAAFLDKSVLKRMAETRCGSAGEYRSLLESDSQEEGRLRDALHVGYSEFFRNPLTFAVLERVVLPSLVRGDARRKEIRVWSTACAAGQEAYSLAMLLEELKDGASYRIFATDQSAAQVEAARRGQYAAAAVDNLKLRQLNRWFTKQGETYAAKPELARNIDFSVFDLLSGQLSSPCASIFGDFDLVFCANLLFYYKPDFQRTILEKVGNALAHGGFLVVGDAERGILSSHGYHEFHPQLSIFKRKTEGGTAP